MVEDSFLAETKYRKIQGLLDGLSTWSHLPNANNFYSLFLGKVPDSSRTIKAMILSFFFLTSTLLMYWQIFSLKKLMIFIQYLIKCNLDYKIESQNTLYKDSGILE